MQPSLPNSQVQLEAGNRGKTQQFCGNSQQHNEKFERTAFQKPTEIIFKARGTLRLTQSELNLTLVHEQPH